MKCITIPDADDTLLYRVPFCPRLPLSGDLLPRRAGQERRAGQSARGGRVVDGREQPRIQRQVRLHGTSALDQ